MGVEAVKETKKNLGWPEDKTFYVPEEARKNWDTIKPKARSCTRSGTRILRSTSGRIRSRRRSSSE
jgi:transketolase